jgi:hypothetical protein
MKLVVLSLAVFAAFAFASDSYHLEPAIPVDSGSDALLQYDDGSAAWIWSGIIYVGTWFDVTDFLPSATQFEVTSCEWWFYHHSSHPWDTDAITLELWKGDATTWPTTNFTSDSRTALHYAPTVVNYSPSVWTGTDFWMIANTSISSTIGLPSTLYDGTANFTGIPHTYRSSDFSTWSTVNSGGIDINAFYRVTGIIPTALERGTWGAIKGIFQSN